MPSSRRTLSRSAAVRCLVLLLAALAMPAPAQEPAARALVPSTLVNRADLSAPPALAAKGQRSEAEAIALASPSLREGARRLKLRGLPAAVSLVALRSVFRGPDRDAFQALLAAGFAKSDLVDAFKQLDRPDAAGMRAKLRELGESPSQSAVHLHRLYPSLGFDGLFALLAATSSADEAFTATAAALGLAVEQIVGHGARYHQGRQVPVGNGSFFPDAGAIAAVVRRLHPGTTQAQLWSRLLAAGYAADAVFAGLPVGDVDRSGRALDAVAGCIALRFPGRRAGSNPSVDITIAPDGSASHDPRQAQCYATFLQSLRGQSVGRAVAAQVIENAVACRPDQSPACPALRTPVLASILEGAGYPPEKR